MGIRLRTKGTSYGVKLPENKLTQESPIEPIPLPQKVIIPLHQNIGAPCQALVKKGQKVLAGQKIGDSERFVNAPVHATISGEISAITTVINPPTGQPVAAFVITSDGADRWVELEPPEEPEALSVKEILGKIRGAGLVGLGGATIPTHVKLSPPEGKKIDTVILNGCECEPYITSDHRVMLEYGEKILSGLNIIRKVLSPHNIYIAIEDNKPDAIDHLEKLILAMGFKEDFKIVPLKSQYPMGAEKTLLNTLLGREVPIGGLPLDVGVVIHNISTTKAIHDAVFEGKPLVERVVTVTGAVKNPKNLLVRLGTPLRNLIDYCGGIDGKADEVILGGPMMGISQPDLDFPVTKGTGCVLVKESSPIRERDCISCGRCLKACPMHLMPTMLAKYAKAGRYDDCKKFYIDNCFECGTCAYVCPANIPIVQYTKIAKSELIKRAATR
ncbi:electron transport complex subunit RsxC [Dehalococcoidia bacterium]|nr:electron transport complex subunit RsxC [Dehalococcoidia bacterium]